MENASKALIIAGAILLAILIISLGIMIYNQASGVVDSNAMDEVAVTSFNEKFRQYEGENIRGANIKALINSIAQNNLSNQGDTSKQVELVFDGATKGKITSSSGITVQTGKSYTVTCDTDGESGYIYKVTVQVKSST